MDIKKIENEINKLNISYINYSNEYYIIKKLEKKINKIHVSKRKYYKKMIKNMLNEFDYYSTLYYKLIKKLYRKKLSIRGSLQHSDFINNFF